MHAAERAKAMVVQLETMRDGERLNPIYRSLTRADCACARDVVSAASAELHAAVSENLMVRIDALDDWLILIGR